MHGRDELPQRQSTQAAASWLTRYRKLGRLLKV